MQVEADSRWSGTVQQPPIDPSVVLFLYLRMPEMNEIEAIERNVVTATN
jgi:hypothetical protein